jgi:CRISPR/Cas system-associated endoribonuclease Cas2
VPSGSPQIDNLRARLLTEIDPQEDSLSLYHFCRDCGGETEIHGTGVCTDDPEVYIL